MVGSLDVMELEAAGRMASTVRKQTVKDISAQLPYSFLCSLGLQPMNWCHPCFGAHGGRKRW